MPLLTTMAEAVGARIDLVRLLRQHYTGELAVEVAANNRDIINAEVDTAAAGQLPGLITLRAKSHRDLRAAVTVLQKKCEDLQVTNALGCRSDFKFYTLLYSFKFCTLAL